MNNALTDVSAVESSDYATVWSPHQLIFERPPWGDFGGVTMRVFHT